MKHFIEECEQYEEIREKLRSRLFFGTGNSEFSCKLFFEVKLEDEFQECSQIISEIFENTFQARNDSKPNNFVNFS